MLKKNWYIFQIDWNCTSCRLGTHKRITAKWYTEQCLSKIIKSLKNLRLNTRSDQKLSRILNFRGLRILNLWFFVPSCWYSCIIFLPTILAIAFLGRVLGRLQFLPILKNGSMYMYQILFEKYNQVCGWLTNRWITVKEDAEDFKIFLPMIWAWHGSLQNLYLLLNFDQKQSHQHC